MSEKQPWWHLGEMRPGFKKVTGRCIAIDCRVFCAAGDDTDAI